MQLPGRAIRTVYALCLLGATTIHVRAVLTRGWLPSELPWPTAIYWSGLMFLDPLAALLLFLRPRAGVALTIAIIVSDVAHNLWFVAANPESASFYDDVIGNPFLLSQIAFLLFVVVTVPTAWQLRRSRDG
jgi:hypothetical protein